MSTPRNDHLGRDYETVTQTDVDTDANGQFTLTFPGLVNIRGPENVTANAGAGYVVNPLSVDGNQVTFELRYGGGAGAELDLVTGSTNVTDVFAQAFGQ